jgi:uncharacterized protein YndB with AHSA1/START domain
MQQWAELVADGARRRITLSRTIGSDIGDVWSALTDPSRASRWLAGLSISGDRVAIGFDEETAFRMRLKGECGDGGLDFGRV